MNPMLTIARRAAEEAGKIIRQGWNQLDQLQVQEKGRGDWVSQIDVQAEQAILQILKDKYPQHDFQGEEMGEVRGRKSEGEYLWLIDPLDGTANFLHGIPHFAVSIALIKNEKIELALVYNPIHEMLFTAARGQGAQCNGRRLRVNGQREAGRTLLATGMPLHQREAIPAHLQQVQEALQLFADVRCYGAAALDLCGVAANQFGAYFERGLKAWDMAAGILIAQEAGAMVSNFKGGSASLEAGEVLCANPYLHKQLLPILERL